LPKRVYEEGILAKILFSKMSDESLDFEESKKAKKEVKILVEVSVNFTIIKDMQMIHYDKIKKSEKNPNPKNSSGRGVSFLTQAVVGLLVTVSRSLTKRLGVFFYISLASYNVSLGNV